MEQPKKNEIVILEDSIDGPRERVIDLGGLSDSELEELGRFYDEAYVELFSRRVKRAENLGQ